MKPDFLGIGFQKSGTSWLFSQLRSHPEFWLPYRKEFHYFDRNPAYPSPNFFSKSLLIQRIFNKHFRRLLIRDIIRPFYAKNFNKALWSTKFYCSSINDDWYINQFNKTYKLTGEFTPSYSILNLEDIKHIFKLLPDVRLIVMMRDPIDRAWSAYRFYNRNKSITFNESVAFFESPLQETRNAYIQTIINYQSVFPRDRMFIGFFDSITEQPEALNNGVAKFIGAKKEFIITEKVFDKINESPSKEMPIEIYSYLKEKYLLEIQTLSETYGSYCTQWYLKHSKTEIGQKKDKNYPAFIIL